MSEGQFDYVPAILKGFLNVFLVFPAFISDTMTDTSSNKIGVIAGSVTGVVLLVAASVVAGILIHKKYQHNQIQSNAEIH